MERVKAITDKLTFTIFGAVLTLLVERDKEQSFKTSQTNDEVMKFRLTQFRVFRQYYGGHWYKIRVPSLPMGDFWSSKSCGAICIEHEYHQRIF